MNSIRPFATSALLGVVSVCTSPAQAQSCWDTLAISGCSRSPALPFWTDPVTFQQCMPREWIPPLMTNHCIAGSGQTNCNNNVVIVNGCRYELPASCSPQTWSGLSAFQNSLGAQLSGPNCE